jgi:hypothetical protein
MIFFLVGNFFLLKVKVKMWSSDAKFYVTFCTFFCVFFALKFVHFTKRKDSKKLVKPVLSVDNITA